MKRNLVYALLAALLSAGLLSAAETARPGDAGWVSYRGPNGTGVFPDSRPPVDCDLKTGRNIVWAAPLPNWCHGSPIVVKERAFVLSEPGWRHDWPVLTCIDAGKVLWEREVNHLSATGLDPAAQGEIARAWHDFHAVWRELYQTFNLQVVQKKAEEGKARFDALGYTFGGHHGGGYGQLRSLRPKDPNQVKARDALFKKAGIHGETWHHGCGLGTDCIGIAYATPVSDGERVYVTTAFSGAACFDLEGHPQWTAFVPTTGRTEAYARSPLLYRDLLISDYFGKLVAFDKATGAIRWTVETGGGSIATPIIISVGGTDLVLSEGKQGAGSLAAVRLPDGKLLPIQGWGIGGTSMVADTDHRDVAYFCGRGQHSFWPESAEAVKPPAAVRFALEGATLKATVLWTGKDFVGAGGYVGMLYHGGKLYCSTSSSAVVIDAASGQLLAGSMEKARQANRPLPPTGHLLLLAGDRFYGLLGRNSRTCDGAHRPEADLYCYSLDGKKLGQSALVPAPIVGDKLEQIRSAVGWDNWPFTYGCPFTIAGNRLYVRGFDQLICIGER